MTPAEIQRYIDIFGEPPPGEELPTQSMEYSVEDESVPQATSSETDEEKYARIFGESEVAPDEVAPYDPMSSQDQFPQREQAEPDELGRAEDLGSRVVRGAVSPIASVGEDLAVDATEASRDAARNPETGAGISASPFGYGDAPFAGDYLIQNTLAGIEDDTARKEAVSELASPTVPDILNNPAWRWAAELRSRTENSFPTDPKWNDEFMSHLAEGIGSTASFAVSSLVSPALTAALGSSAAASDQFKDAVQSGATVDEALEAASGAEYLGLTEVVPISRAFKRLDKATGGKFSEVVADNFAKRVATEGVKGAAEEAIQEGFIQFGSNVLAKDIVGYAEDREYLAGVEQSAEVGGGVGFLMSTLMTAAGLKHRQYKETKFVDSLVGDLKPEAIDRIARERLDPNRAQAWIDTSAGEQRILPQRESLEPSISEGNVVTLGTPSRTRRGTPYTGARRIRDAAANEPQMFDSDLDEIGFLITRLIGGDIPEGDRAAALEQIDAYVEKTKSSVSNVVDITKRLQSDPEYWLRQLSVENEIGDQGTETFPELTTRMSPNELPQAINQAGMGGFRSLVEFVSGIYNHQIQEMKLERREGETVIYVKPLKESGELDRYSQKITIRDGDTQMGLGDNIDHDEFDAVGALPIPLSRKDGKENTVSTFPEPEARGLDTPGAVQTFVEEGNLDNFREQPQEAAPDADIDVVPEPVQDEAPETAALPVAEDPSIPEQILPDQPYAPPSAPITANLGDSIRRGDVAGKTNQIKTLAIVGEYGKERIAIDLGAGFEVDQVSSKDGTKQVTRVTLQDGSKKTLTEEQVMSLVLSDTYSLRENPLGWARQWISKGKTAAEKRLNASSTVTKKVTTMRLQQIFNESKAHLNVWKHTGKQLQEEWRDVHGQDIASATKEQRAAMNAYLTGNIGAAAVARATGMSGKFVKNLQKIRKAVDGLSHTVVKGNMVDGALQTVFRENMGTYMRIQYALKDMEARNTDAGTLLERIPEDRRNAASRALRQAYMSPLFQPGGKNKMGKGTLIRMAKLYGLTEQRLPDEEYTTSRKTGEEKRADDYTVLKGDTKYLGDYKAKDLRIALQQRLSEQRALPDEILLKFLQPSTAKKGDSVSGGREKSIERARKLSRTDEQFKEAGYSAAEIQFNHALREMLAEIEDPISSAQNTMQAMIKTITSHRMVNAVAELSVVGAASLNNPRVETGATEQLIPTGDSWDNIRVVDHATGNTIPATQVYVRPEVRDAFNRLVRPNFKSLGEVWNLARLAQGATKTGMTALNLGSHPRNTRSASELLAWRGYVLTDDPKQFFAAISTAMSLGARDSAYGFKGKAKPDHDAAIAYLVSLGIFHDGIRTGAIKDMLLRVASSRNLEDAFGKETLINIDGRTVEELSGEYRPLRQRLGGFVNRTGGPRTLETARKAVWDGPLSIYRLEDEAFKVVAFMQQRAEIADMLDKPELIEVMNGDREPTAEEIAEIKEIDKKASYVVRNAFPTYSKVPEVWKDLSANMLAVPFPSFNLEMIRNSYFDLRDMAAMYNYLRAGDKAEAAGANFYHGMNPAKVYKRLAKKQLSWMGMSVYTAGQIAAISSAYALLASGAQPEDDDEVTQKAKTLRDAITKLGYEPSVTDMDVLDPFVRPLMFGWAANNELKIQDFQPGKSITFTDMNFTLPMSQLTSLGVDITGAVNSIMEGDTEEAARSIRIGVFQFMADYLTAEPLAKSVVEALSGETDFGIELNTLQDKVTHVGKVALPGSQTLKQMKRLMSTNPEDPHRQAFVDFIAGERPITIDIPKGYMRGLWPNVLELKDRTTEIKKLFREAAETGMNPEEFKERYVAFEEDREDAFTRIEFVNRSAEVLGLDEYERRKLIGKSSIVGSNAINKFDYLTDKYRPIIFGPGDLYRKGEEPNDDLTSAYREYIEHMKEAQREAGWIDGL